MAIINEDRDRKVIPRWRDYRATVAQREFSSRAVKNEELDQVEKKEADDQIQARQDDFAENHTFSFAAELVATALATGREPDAFEAAEFILSDTRHGEATKAIARQLLGIKSAEIEAPIDTKTTQDELRGEVRHLKARLRDDPRDSFGWVDLARAYESLGFAKKAVDAITMADRLAPGNRFVRRAMARMYLHHEDYDKAHAIIRQTPSLKSDPWLLASEIATSSVIGKTSEFIRHGLAMLDSGKFSAIQISELASAIATVESEAGDFKISRKHLRLSLVDPNENAIAQASWFVRKGALEAERPIIISGAKSHEAAAWEASAKQEWGKSIKESIGWLLDEPFSSRPICMGSFMAAVALQDYDQSIELLRFGLLANPKEFLILNNLTFAYARKGRLREAREYYAQIKALTLEPDQQVFSLATAGLIKYREGDTKAGQSLYEQAITLAMQLDDKALAVKAFIFQLVEEINAGVAGAQEAKAEVLKIFEDKEKVIKDVTFLPVLHHLRTFKPPERRTLEVSSLRSGLMNSRKMVNHTIETKIVVPKPPSLPPAM